MIDSNKEGFFGFRARLDKPGASMAAFTFFSLKRLPPSPSQRAVCIVHIYFLLVSSEVRGLGIGNKLVTYVLHFAKSLHPGARMFVEIEAKNTKNALGFWVDKMGFTLAAQPEEDDIAVPLRDFLPACSREAERDELLECFLPSLSFLSFLSSFLSSFLCFLCF